MHGTVYVSNKQLCFSGVISPSSLINFVQMWLLTCGHVNSN